MIAKPPLIQASVATLERHIAAAGHCLEVTELAHNEIGAKRHRQRIAGYETDLKRLQRHLQQSQLRKRA